MLGLLLQHVRLPCDMKIPTRHHVEINLSVSERVAVGDGTNEFKSCSGRRRMDFEVVAHHGSVYSES